MSTFPLPRRSRSPKSSAGFRSPIERLESRLLMATASANGNPVPIYIYSHPEEVPTPASVYASVAIIRNLEGPISDVRVTLQGFSHEAPEDVDVAYSGWSETYDAGTNPVFAVEEPAVRAILSRIEPGRALDAACAARR